MPRQDNFPVPQPIFGEPVFNENGDPTPDPDQSFIPPNDEQQYKQIQNLLSKDVVSFSQMAGQPGDLYSLATALGASGGQIVQNITTNGQIVFQVIGDSGATKASTYAGAISVADAITNQIQSAAPIEKPAFLYHVGDVVYDFGQSQYYYEEFYEPFRNYPAPIFAIPGNHDSFIIPGTPADQAPLTIFSSNFCAEHPVVTKEAGSLHRTAGTQPGVYFTLDAPFVRIIGLFSNALEHPGVISSQGGKWKNVPPYQIAYLEAQLQRVKEENYSGALIIAVHHPPFTYSPPNSRSGGGGNTSSSIAMLAEIDAVCISTGVYPHAFLSGHSHNYQRYTRTILFGGKQLEVPFIVCGNSGHDVTPLTSAKGGVAAGAPTFGEDVSYLDVKAKVTTQGLKLEEFDDASSHYGYLTVTANAAEVTIAYSQVPGGGAGPAFTPVTVNLSSHTIS